MKSHIILNLCEKHPNFYPISHKNYNFFVELACLLREGKIYNIVVPTIVHKYIEISLRTQ
jgi:hypothetical protein